MTRLIKHLTLPNQLSLVRIALSPIFLYLFCSDISSDIIISSVILLIASLTDWYDGWHARKFGVITRIGIFLDPLADKILTTLAFLAFWLKGIMPLWMVIVIAIRDIVITILRSYNELKGITIKTSFVAKLKTFLQMTYIFFIVICYVILASGVNDSLMEIIFYFLHSPINYFVMLFITLITAYTGIRYFFEKKIEDTSKLKQSFVDSNII